MSTQQIQSLLDKMHHEDIEIDKKLSKGRLSSRKETQLNRNEWRKCVECQDKYMVNVKSSSIRELGNGKIGTCSDCILRLKQERDLQVALIKKEELENILHK